MVDYGTWKGNYTGTVVYNNTTFGGFANEDLNNGSKGVNGGDAVIKYVLKQREELIYDGSIQHLSLCITTEVWRSMRGAALRKRDLCDKSVFSNSRRAVGFVFCCVTGMTFGIGLLEMNLRQRRQSIALVGCLGSHD